MINQQQYSLEVVLLCITYKTRFTINQSAFDSTGCGEIWLRCVQAEKVVERYGSLPGVLHMIELEKGRSGLGLSLAGNRDRSRMSVFVVGIDPNGAAGRDGRIIVGDELLEVRPDVGADIFLTVVTSRLKCFFDFFRNTLVSHALERSSFSRSFDSLPLQINGQILYGRSHQNASSIIKSAPSKVKIIFIRWV